MNKILLLVFVCFSSFVFCLQSEGGQSAVDFASPYENVELLPFDGFGWYFNGPQFEHLITKDVKIVVEVGCYIGLSTRHIASLLPPDGKVYAVDHWLGSEEHQPGAYNGKYCHTPPERLYQQFLSNVIHEGLQDKIIPVRMESREAAQYLSGISVDLVYIDGSHDTDSVYKDLTAWYPFVKGHGILCGDDWHHPPIVKAVTQFAEENSLEIIVESNGGAPEHDKELWRLVEKK